MFKLNQITKNYRKSNENNRAQSAQTWCTNLSHPLRCVLRTSLCKLPAANAVVRGWLTMKIESRGNVERHFFTQVRRWHQNLSRDFCKTFEWYRFNAMTDVSALTRLCAFNRLHPDSFVENLLVFLFITTTVILRAQLPKEFSLLALISSQADVETSARVMHIRRCFPVIKASSEHWDLLPLELFCAVLLYTATNRSSSL